MSKEADRRPSLTIIFDEKGDEVKMSAEMYRVRPARIQRAFGKVLKVYRAHQREVAKAQAEAQAKKLAAEAKAPPVKAPNPLSNAAKVAASEGKGVKKVQPLEAESATN